MLLVRKSNRLEIDYCDQLNRYGFKNTQTHGYRHACRHGYRHRHRHWYIRNLSLSRGIMVHGDDIIVMV